MPLEAVGPLSVPVQRLVDLIAESVNFQQWVGAANETLARQRIYRNAEATFVRPFALLGMPEGNFRVKRGGYPAGRIRVLFEANVSPAWKDDDESSMNEFTNAVGQIVADIMTLSEATPNKDRLFIPDSGIEIGHGPWRSDKTENEDYMQMSFWVPFGLLSNP